MSLTEKLRTKALLEYEQDELRKAFNAREEEIQQQLIALIQEIEVLVKEEYEKL